MTVTEPIFTKPTLALQKCVNNYNTKFNENLTNSGATDARSEKKDEQMWHPNKIFFLYRKECLNAV